MASFQTMLKPDATAGRARAAHVKGYFACLKLNGKIVFTGDNIYRTREFGADAREMAIDEARTFLHAQPGSLAAEVLQAICDAGEAV